MTLDAAYDADNVFAKIVRGELPAAKVFEDDDVVAFMDLFPQSKGHALVILKETEAVNILDVDPTRLQTLVVAVQKLARAVRKALSPDGVRVVQFNGAPAGQTVYHLHFHVIPIYEDAPLGRHGGGQADPEELKALSEKIASAL